MQERNAETGGRYALGGAGGGESRPCPRPGTLKSGGAGHGAAASPHSPGSAQAATKPLAVAATHPSQHSGRWAATGTEPPPHICQPPPTRPHSSGLGSRHAPPST
eukprot:365506-Chlamydomonas_euryale.AAC.12